MTGPLDQWTSGPVDQWPLSAFPHPLMMNLCTVQQLSVSKFRAEWFSIISAETKVLLMLSVKYEVQGINI